MFDVKIPFFKLSMLVARPISGNISGAFGVGARPLIRVWMEATHAGAVS